MFLAADDLQTCLRDGQWVVQPAQVVNGSGVLQWKSTWRRLRSRATARHPFNRLPQHTDATLAWGRACREAESTSLWLGTNKVCTQLYDPLTGDFGGVFSQEPTQKVSLFVLGDSIGGQLENSIRVVAAANPSLRGIQFVSFHSWLYSKHTELTLIPSDPAGGLELLRGISWHGGNNTRNPGERPRGSCEDMDTQVVLANAGAHYNWLPTCAAHRRCPPGEAPTPSMCMMARSTPMSERKYYLDTLCNCGPLALKPNHTFPSLTRLQYPVSKWSRSLLMASNLYDKARKALLTDTLGQYGKDMHALSQAALQWQREAPSCTRRMFLWVENSPQHFQHQSSTVHNTSGNVTSGRHCGDSVSGYQANSHASHDNSTAQNGTASIASRDEIASPIMAAAGIPIVPIADALAKVGRLHLGGSDCTHWCPGSDATYHMAYAALNVIQAELGLRHERASSP